VYDFCKIGHLLGTALIKSAMKGRNHLNSNSWIYEDDSKWNHIYQMF